MPSPRHPAKRDKTRRDTPQGGTRESRGPETSHYLEDDTFSLGKAPPRAKDRAPAEFDDDLIR